MQWLKVISGLVFFMLPVMAEEVGAIIAQTLARDEQMNEALKRYQYFQEVLVERLGEGDKVKESQRLEMVVKPGEGGYSVVADGNGAALLPDQVTKQQNKAAKESEQLKANFSLRKLAGRFKVTLAGEERVGGNEAYILAFEPLGGQPYTDRIEKILNHLQGRMWVDKSDYTILKTQAKLTRDVDMAWFFATMEELDFYYESQPIPGGVGPKRFDVAYRVSVFLGEIRQRQFITMRDFKKL